MASNIIEIGFFWDWDTYTNKESNNMINKDTAKIVST